MTAIKEVKERLDLVETVSAYVNLKRSGQTYKGLCPFHSEKTPSFVVYPDSQTWHCFGGCGDGGDIFDFVEKIEGLDFADTLKLLAQQAGVELAPPTEAEVERAEARDRLKEVNAAAARYFHNLLVNNPAAKIARDYLLGRGLERDAWDAFQLGYALDEWEGLIGYLTRKRSYSLDDLADAGLVSERKDSSGYYDRFRNRLMFPIYDVGGDVVGFGARALAAEDVPKYLNSPQTTLFDKSRTLYGIDRARQPIRQAEQAIIVEGYTDVITAHMHGFENVVASLGTALTEDQLKILKRYTRRFVLALDADAAGSQAMLRGLDVARDALDTETVPVPTARGYVRYESRLDAEIRVLVLPEGTDPDVLIRSDAGEWERLVAEAETIVDWLFIAHTRDLDLDSPQGKSEAVKRLLPVIADVGGAVEQSHYIQRLARLVQVDEQVLTDQLRQTARRPRYRRRPPPPEPEPEERGDVRRRPAAGAGGSRLTEDYVLASLLHHPSLWSTLAQRFEELSAASLSAEDFVDTANRHLYAAFQQAWTSGDVGSSTALLEQLKATLASPLDEQLDALIELTSAQPTLPDADRQDSVMQAALRLRAQTCQRQISQLRFMLESAGSDDDVLAAGERLRQHAAELARLHRALAARDTVQARNT